MMVRLRVLWTLALFVGLAVGPNPARAQERLQLTTMSGPGQMQARIMQPWAERVEKDAKGTLSVQLRYGVTLANFTNVYDRVMDDVVQLGWIAHGLAAGQFPLSEVGALPFTVESGEEGSTALWRLYKRGLLDAEYRDVVPLMFGIFPQNRVHLAKTPKSLENLNGLKLGVTSKAQAVMAQRLGASPVSMQMHEYYEATQRGTLDGFIIGFGSFPNFKFEEVTSYHIEVPLGSNTTVLVMARKKFDALPPDARKALQDNGGESGSRAWGKGMDDLTTRPSDGKHTFVNLTPVQLNHWRAMLEPVADDWASSRTDGAKAVAAYRTIVTQMRSEKKSN